MGLRLEKRERDALEIERESLRWVCVEELVMEIEGDGERWRESLRWS